MTIFRRSGRVACALVLAASLSGCALFISDPEERAEVIETNDPIEGVNRHIFAVNLALDTFILRPVSVVYREFMPDPGKDMVRNFVHNLKLPFTAINDLLQGEPERAETAMSRFLVNSTAGVGGLFDAATGLGLDYHEEDFGQTLAVHGSEEGPYLMLPIFGPSNLRDAIGLVVQYFTDPVGIAADEAGADDFGLITGGMEAVDSRARHIETFDTLQQQSLDFYAAVRSLYRQRRAAEIRNFESDAVPTTPIANAADAAPEALAAVQVAPERQPAAAATAPPPRNTTAAERPVAAATTAAVTVPAVPDTIVSAPAPLPRRVEPPAAGTPTDQFAALPESTPAEPRQSRVRVDDSDIGHNSDLKEEHRRMPPRRPVPSTTKELAETPRGVGGTGSFAEALRAFDEAARSFDAMTGVAPGRM